MNDFINNFDIEKAFRSILDVIFTARDTVEPIFDEYRTLLYIVGGLVSLLFGGISFWLLVKSKFFISKADDWADALFAGNTLMKRRTLRGWKTIVKDLGTDDAKKHKDAILLADLIFGEILRLAGYRGQTVHERLDQVPPGVLPNIEGLRRAHKMRDAFHKGTAPELTRDEAIAIVGEYRRAFQEFGLID
ncbi:MAG: hypothetical protein AAB407_00335 [Patescibacteria group bacterium]